MNFTSRLAALIAPGGLAIRWASSILLALALCGAAFWIWNAPLRSYYLKLDDFAYLARSRTTSALRAHLLTPHNGHIVPLFLLETYLLGRLAGSLVALPAVLGFASYGMLVVTMAAMGHLVAWETGRVAIGLAAMSAVGFASVLGPALVWYSAGQALAGGTMLLVMLAALQRWRARGQWWLMGIGSLAAIAAPLFWTAGYSAGPVGMAYLWADGRPRCRRAAALPLAVSVAAGLLVRGTRQSAIPAAKDAATQSIVAAVHIGPALVHSAQAVCEKLVINNIGFDATTTAPQSLVLILLLGLAWAWSRWWSVAASSAVLPMVNPLEAAGAVMVAASFGMVFGVRGTETTFDNLRALGWYDAIPQLGAVLFGAGWAAGRLKSPPPQSLEPPRHLELLAAALFAGAMLVLQLPRVERVIFEYDGLAAPIAADGLLERGPSSPAGLAERAREQRRALAELDGLALSLTNGTLSPAAIRSKLARIRVPGMPENLDGQSPIDLIEFAGSKRDVESKHRGPFSGHE
jgi:hypothetical protein